MRIALVSWSRRKVGGAETYLESIIPDLVEAGHEVAFWHEADSPKDHDRIILPEGTPAWSVADIGSEKALIQLRKWQPSVLFTHSLMDPGLERQLLQVAPAVFFAHAYYGTCISGGKAFKNPILTPCHRRFGWQCLAYYYPRHCGGLSPVTMIKEYRRQSRRLAHLNTYKAIVTLSTHMQAEYIQHGFAPERVECLSHFSDGEPSGVESEARGIDQNTASQLFNGWRLLFVGRMDLLKGGRVLLEALPLVASTLKQPLHLTFAGEGTDRANLEQHAIKVEQRSPGLKIEFAGWLSKEQLENLWKLSHLLVIPSLWPEPFGLVGIEAGAHGIPTAAFAVGGITDWLKEGTNGHLAPGDPPTAKNLAAAILKCLKDKTSYLGLRAGAFNMSREFRREIHLARLLNVLERAAFQN